MDKDSGKLESSRKKHEEAQKKSVDAARELEKAKDNACAVQKWHIGSKSSNCDDQG